MPPLFCLAHFPSMEKKSNNSDNILFTWPIFCWTGDIIPPLHLVLHQKTANDPETICTQYFYSMLSISNDLTINKMRGALQPRNDLKTKHRKCLKLFSQ